MKFWLAQQKTLSECEVSIGCHLLSQEMKLVNHSAVMLVLPSADGAAALGLGLGLTATPVRLRSFFSKARSGPLAFAV